MPIFPKKKAPRSVEFDGHDPDNERVATFIEKTHADMAWFQEQARFWKHRAIHLFMVGMFLGTVTEALFRRLVLGAW